MAFKLVLTSLKYWKADNVLKHSAAVSFYTLFSLAPVTIIALAVSSAFLGEEHAGRALRQQVTQLVGPASAQLVETAAAAGQQPGTSSVATLVSGALLLFGATTVFAQLQESMNAIWGVRAKPSRRGWLVLVMQRLISFAMVLIVGFLLLVSLVLSTLLSTAVEHLGSLAGAAPLLRAADLGVAFVVIAALFALMFKVLPDVVLRWRDVLGSALLTAVLFTLGRHGIALYLAHSTVASIYGAAGSLVALLVWVYYSCAILFFGVELTRATREAHGPPVRPKDTAVRFRVEVLT